MSSELNRLGTMQPDVLRRLRMAVETNTQDLQDAMARKKLNTVAWVTRNLLELAIWCQYCAKSEENSKEFVLEAGRDVIDLLNVPDGLFSATISFREYRDEMLHVARADGLETLDDAYRRVSDVANELGKGEIFRHVNKLLSKFAHPTAVTIVQNGSAYETTLREKFYQIGIRLSNEMPRGLPNP